MSPAPVLDQHHIITVIGQDKTGIVAQVSSFLWQRKINIEEIQQGIMQGKFFMVMAVDASLSESKIPELSDELSRLGEQIGVKILIYDQGIFTAMHKV
jgi:ACT domain-containing protein